MLDTIYALASARGRAGVSIIRISGQKAHEALGRMVSSIPEPRKASLRKLSWCGVILDEALVLVFARGASFTGEDSVELHLHGGRAVVGAVLAALSEMQGLRMAEPGEFTRRALENGCLDLTQVEGLADLIDAETEAQRVQSLRVLSGAIGQKVELWRKNIIRAGALLEATIDFADEDIPVDVMPEVRDLLDGLIETFIAEAEGAKIAERIREGFEVAIIGRPNAGKSTLLNAFAGREAAITSEIAGTTRDVIEVRMDLRGLAVTFLDTAGLRSTDDLVERLGVNLAIDRANSADLRVFLLDDGGMIEHVSVQEGDLIVAGKSDTDQGQCAIDLDHHVSGLTGVGVSELLDAIGGTLAARTVGTAVLTRERHRVAIMSALQSLRIARKEVDMAVPMAEIAADELRSAARSLEVLVGRIDIEALLGEIFASFCIGK